MSFDQFDDILDLGYFLDFLDELIAHDLPVMSISLPLTKIHDEFLPFLILYFFLDFLGLFPQLWPQLTLDSFHLHFGLNLIACQELYLFLESHFVPILAWINLCQEDMIQIIHDIILRNKWLQQLFIFFIKIIFAHSLDISLDDIIRHGFILVVFIVKISQFLVDDLHRLWKFVIWAFIWSLEFTMGMHVHHLKDMRL